MLEYYILINYSKSALNTFHLDYYIQLTLSADTHSIDDFKAKFRAAALQQKQNWNEPQIKD